MFIMNIGLSKFVHLDFARIKYNLCIFIYRIIYARI